MNEFLNWFGETVGDYFKNYMLVIAGVIFVLLVIFIICFSIEAHKNKKFNEELELLSIKSDIDSTLKDPVKITGLKPSCECEECEKKECCDAKNENKEDTTTITLEKTVTPYLVNTVPTYVKPEENKEDESTSGMMKYTFDILMRIARVFKAAGEFKNKTEVANYIKTMINADVLTKSQILNALAIIGINENYSKKKDELSKLLLDTLMK